MSSETHVTEQLAAYALNLLDADEAAQVAAHLATCATCQAELDAYQEITSLLTLAAPTVPPPATLKTRLMQEIGAEEDGVETAVPTPKAPPKISWRNWFGKRPIWQPALALALIILLISNFQLRQQLDDTRTPANFGTVTLSSETSAEATGLIIISGDGEYGTLIVQNLAQLPEAQAYQLWLIKDGQRTSGGLFNVSEDGYLAKIIYSPEPLAHYQTFGITIEPAEGSPGPTGEKVLGS
ncbi:MAG: anti-sigma factor [Chloroflexota bacterium]